MKIIAIAGARNCKKDLLAFRLAKNSDCIWVKPYTDLEYPANLEYFEQDDYVHLNERKLSAKMEREVPLCVTEAKGHRYVFFENQFNAGYCVITADDRVIQYLKGNWKGDLVTVKCHSKTEEYSERNLLSDDDFDIVYNYDEDDYDYFEAMIQ